VQEAFIKLNNEAQMMGLNKNEEKTKYMEITAKPTKNKYLNVGNYRFEKVTEFKYLGTMISYDNNLDVEIHHRLLLANMLLWPKETNKITLHRHKNEMKIL
jgi:hypothetical protein